MANPQKENGYTPIAHEIMEAFSRTRIPGECRQILDFVLRKTYGWDKKGDTISLSQFCEATKLSKSHICRGINKLIEMNVITKKGNAQSLFTKKGNDIIPVYCFQKDYDKWRTLPKKVTLPKKATHVTQKGNCTLPKKGHTIDISLQKKSLQKISSQKFFADDSIEIKLSKLLYSLILERNPNQKYPNLQKWAYRIDLMIRKDNRDPENIERVIKWCQADNIPNKKGFCWANNILSTNKLREQYDQLFLKMKKNQKPKHNFSQGAIDYLKKKGCFDEQK